MGQRNRVQRFKDPRHKSFLYGGVCSFVCVHHDPGFYSCTGDWVNEIACLPREARVPEDWRETTPSLLPGHVTQSKSGNQKPKQPPWLLPPRNILLKIHQLTRREVKRRASSTETSKFHLSELLREPVIWRVILILANGFIPISKGRHYWIMATAYRISLHVSKAKNNNPQTSNSVRRSNPSLRQFSKYGDVNQQELSGRNKNKTQDKNRPPCCGVFLLPWIYN